MLVKDARDNYMKKIFEFHEALSSAISHFWREKENQAGRSIDTSNRGTVLGGKQMDGFIYLIRDACMAAGVPGEYIYLKNNYIPGFFRSSKNWDIMVVTPKGQLLAVIELKSQIGSYGNNFNNRAEEAIGNSTDFWTAYRDMEFPTRGTPWVGYMMLIGKDEKSTQPVKNNENLYPVLPIFKGASYLTRYRILCEKLMTERLYTAACLIWTSGDGSFGNVTEDLSAEEFINSLQGYLIGHRNDFNR